MKRSYPPDSYDEIAADRRTIEERLQRLYQSEEAAPLKLPCNRKGYYCDGLHHVRLAAETKLHQFEGMIQYSTSLGYHYFNSYQALYLMECRQLMVFFNELPLSLAEAYRLLLPVTVDLQRYIVFSYLNRNGFFCLEPTACDEAHIGNLQDRTRPQQVMLETDAGSNDEPVTPLFRIHTIMESFQSIISRLRQVGPRDYSHRASGNRNDLKIVFDVYKRESFSKHKPRRGKAGNPDYYVIISDTHEALGPSCRQLAETESILGRESCRKLLYAVMDSDNSFSFLHFDPTDEPDLEFHHDRWPEQISVRNLAEAQRF